MSEFTGFPLPPKQGPAFNTSMVHVIPTHHWAFPAPTPEHQLSDGMIDFGGDNSLGREGNASLRLDWIIRAGPHLSNGPIIRMEVDRALCFSSLNDWNLLPKKIRDHPAHVAQQPLVGSKHGMGHIAMKRSRSPTYRNFLP